MGILEPLQEPLAEVRERLQIRGMDSRTSTNFRDKARMKEVFAEADIPCARHRLCASVDEQCPGLRHHRLIHPDCEIVAQHVHKIWTRILRGRCRHCKRDQDAQDRGPQARTG